MNRIELSGYLFSVCSRNLEVGPIKGFQEIIDVVESAFLPPVGIEQPINPVLTPEQFVARARLRSPEFHLP